MWRRCAPAALLRSVWYVNMSLVSFFLPRNVETQCWRKQGKKSEGKEENEGGMHKQIVHIIIIIIFFFHHSNTCDPHCMCDPALIITQGRELVTWRVCGLDKQRERTHSTTKVLGWYDHQMSGRVSKASALSFSSPTHHTLPLSRHLPFLSLCPAT